MTGSAAPKEFVLCLFSVMPNIALPSVIAVLMLEWHFCSFELLIHGDNQRNVFANNWDIPLVVRSIAGQLNEGMLTLSQQGCNEAP